MNDAPLSHRGAIPWQRLVDGMPDGLLVVDADGEILFANERMSELAGYPAHELVGTSVEVLVPDELRARHQQHRRGLGASQARRPMGTGLPIVLRRADGGRLPVDVGLSAITDEGRHLTVAAIRDDALRRQSEQERASALARALTAERTSLAAAKRFQAGFARAVSGMCVLSDDGHVLELNTALAASLGEAPGALVGRDWMSLVLPEDAREARAQLDGARQGRRAKHSELRYRRRDGSSMTALTSWTAVPDEAGSSSQVFGHVLDVTDKTAAHQELERLALHDPLTGLANRALLTDRVESALRRGARSGAHVALLFLDLDQFKLVNDTLGHEAGDDVLRQTAARLLAEVRPGDSVARLGGDEFVVLAEDVDVVTARDLAERIRARVARPLHVAGRDVAVGVSIGIALGSADTGTSARALLRDADAAMYAAKSKGRGRCELFGEQLREDAQTRLDLQHDLVQALAADALAVHYQPIVSLADEQPIGVEALVRWTRDGEEVDPAEFIPIAEQTGLIERVTDLVLRQATTQVAAWRELCGMTGLWVSVNISARELDERLPARVQQALAQAGLPGPALVLEVTETSLTHDLDGAQAALAQLAELGVRAVVDDFGTGYSSLSRLRNLPVSGVKMDRGFTAEVLDATAGALPSSISALAMALGLQSVAEGIESAAQRDHLRGVGFTCGQGFLWSRAVPAQELPSVWSQLAAGPRDAGPVAEGMLVPAQR